jgi:iron(III) transport system ATP-binding protein
MRGEVTGHETDLQTSEFVAAEPPAVCVQRLVKTFRRRSGSEVRAIDTVDLTVQPGEFVVLLGPSGCGKTTLLRCIAGLETPDDGSITIAGRSVFHAAERRDLPPNSRQLNMMFQSYALWPHMTVSENVEFPLRTRRVPRKEAKVRASEVLELIGIGELARSHPGQLSGGQQQRVALARALVNGDRLILFDEPLSNVDARVREQLRLELLEMQKRLGFAAIYVTHDQQEAMELADRVVVLQSGRIAQDAAPEHVYHRPASLYVANFVGSANAVKATIDSTDEHRTKLSSELGPISAQAMRGRAAAGDQVVAVWRPELGQILADDDTPGWTGRVHASMFGGGYTTVVVDVAGHLLRFMATGPCELPVDSPIRVRVPSQHIVCLPATDGGEDALA